jgi:hypothetical protein
MCGRALSPVHAAQVYRAAAAPRFGKGTASAVPQAPHYRGRAALQRRVSVQINSGFSPRGTSAGPRLDLTHHPHSVPPRHHESALHLLPHKRKKEPDCEGATA